MRTLLFLAIILSTGTMATANQNQASPGRWFRATHPKAVVMLAHGLNLKPEKMDSLAKVFVDSGIDALRITMTGHDGDMGAFKEVRPEIWASDFENSYDEARKRASELKVPLYFVGYSLGALTAIRNFYYNSSLSFDRMALFAPPVALKAHAQLFKMLKIFGPRFCVPSFSLPEYRVHDCTPMGAYTALFDSVREVQVNPGASINLPTVVFIDPNDELISYNALKKFISKKKLDQWNVIELNGYETALPKKIHHLIIDENGAGSKEWKIIVENLKRHFSL